MLCHPIITLPIILADEDIGKDEEEAHGDGLSDRGEEDANESDGSPGYDEAIDVEETGRFVVDVVLVSIVERDELRRPWRL